MNNTYFVAVNGGESVMVFSKATPSQVIDYFQSRIDFADAFEVSDDEVQYYLFEPLWLTPFEEDALAS